MSASKKGRRTPRPGDGSEPASTLTGKRTEMSSSGTPGRARAQHLWSEEEVKSFHVAYHRYGPTWQKVAKAIGRSAEQCEALYKQHAAYLSIDKQYQHEVAFIAMVRDHQRLTLQVEVQQEDEILAAEDDTDSGYPRSEQPAQAAASDRIEDVPLDTSDNTISEEAVNGGGAAGAGAVLGGPPARSAGRRTIKPTAKVLQDIAHTPRSSAKALPRTPGSGGSQQRRRPDSSVLGVRSPIESPATKRKRAKRLHFDEQGTVRPSGWRRQEDRSEEEAKGVDALLSLAACMHAASGGEDGATGADSKPEPAGFGVVSGASAMLPSHDAGGAAVLSPYGRTRILSPRAPQGVPQRAEPAYAIADNGHYYLLPGQGEAYHSLAAHGSGIGSGFAASPGAGDRRLGGIGDGMHHLQHADSTAATSGMQHAARAGSPGSRKRRRKPAPERLPAMVSHIRSLFVRRTSFTALPGQGLSLGIPGGGLDATAGLLIDGGAEARLRHCLSPRVRRWAMYEFAASALDRPWFMQNELKEFLTHLGLGSVTHLTRAEWRLVRGALGPPRRLSLRFLKEERAKLATWRDTVRGAYEELARGNLDVVPSQLPRPLQVGQKVTARHPVTRQIHDGQVLTAEASAYRVQFERRELGVELVRDVDVMPVNPHDNLPAALVASGATSSLLLSGHAPVGGGGRPRGRGWGYTGRAGGGGGGEGLSREALVASLAEMNCALEKKEALLVQLRAMNDEVESGTVEPSQPLADPFKHGYAGVVLTLKSVNQELEGGLIRLDQCVAGPDGTLHMLVPQHGQPQLLQAGDALGGGAPGSGAAGGGGASAVRMVSEAWVEAQELVERCRSQLGGSEEQGPDEAAAPTSATDADASAARGKAAAGPCTSAGGSASDEAGWLGKLITGCVSTLLILQQCADAGLPPDTVSQALDSALMFVQPHDAGNEPLYGQIRESLDALKAQLAIA